MSFREEVLLPFLAMTAGVLAGVAFVSCICLLYQLTFAGLVLASFVFIGGALWWSGYLYSCKVDGE